MEQNNKNEAFQYTYSAKEQAEIRSIREKYEQGPKKEDKMERLRRLDARATQTAQAVSLIFGVIGTLIFGLGLSLVMSNLGELIGGICVDINA